jgi:fumarylacetoacetase
MHTSFEPKLRSWVSYHEDTDFPIQNIPFGVASRADGPKFCASRIGNHVIDLSQLHMLDAFNGILLPPRIFNHDALNPFIALGKEITDSVRRRLINILAVDSPHHDLKRSSGEWLIPLESVRLHLPVEIGDYTDFYSSIEHATNVGTMFRDASNPLLPNWKHLPVGYHGRASSIFVSGHSFPRPKGQLKPDDGPPIFGPSTQMDFELEMGFIVGKQTNPGESVPIAEAENYIFGLTLFNDWSARDIQKWEYVPLGPFLGKNFASTVSPWIVTLEALEPFKIAGPRQEPEVLPYLKAEGHFNYDLELEVAIQPEKGSPSIISRSNFKYMYWSMVQQLAHHTVNGCNIRIGDLYASGTISGPTQDSLGSLLELSWKGTREVTLAEGETRKFLKDGDTVILSGRGKKEGVSIGFGECKATLLPPN